MKKTKRVCTFILSAMFFVLAGCASRQPVANEELLFSYESYDELLSLTAFGGLYGEIDINDDPAYVTEGKHSAKFILDNTYGFYPVTAAGPTTETPRFSFRSSDLPERFIWLDRLSKFSLDIYNGEDEEFTLYMCITDGDGKYLYADGAKLSGKSWTYVEFDLKPWFFSKDTAFGDIEFYLRGTENADGGKAELYLDNVRVTFYDGAVPPVSCEKEIMFGGIELLPFRSYADSRLIKAELTTIQYSIAPLIRTDYIPTIEVNGIKGALRVITENCYIANSLWEEADRITLDVHSSVLERVSSCKSISVVCYNPDNFDKYVVLSAEGSGKVSVRQRICAGGTEKIILSDNYALKNLIKLGIEIECWRTAGRETLYFTDLVYNV